MNYLSSPSSRKSVPDGMSTDDVNMACSCPPRHLNAFIVNTFAILSFAFLFLGALRAFPLHVFPPTAPTLNLSPCATSANMIPVPRGSGFDVHVTEIHTFVAPPGHLCRPRGIEHHHQTVHVSVGFGKVFCYYA